MDKATKRRLLSIAKRAESLASEIRQLCETSELPLPEQRHIGPPSPPIEVDTDSIVAELRGKSREDALALLQKLSHSQLGAVYRKLGGSSQEAKKPKPMVTDRIIWTLFDFQRGHDILKNQ